MTALSAPGPSPSPSPAPSSAAAVRPRLARWVLRLHRPALYTWTALVVLTTVLLLLLRGPFTDAAAEGWRQFDACGFHPRCGYDQAAILRYKDWYNYATLAMSAVPFLTAAWAGGALFGRELESGTARLAWAQSSSPVRWLTVRLAVPAAVVTAGSALLVWLHHQAWSAGRGRVDTLKQWYDIWTFHTNGPTLVALALAGLAAGALTGLLCRRALPALALGLLLTGAIWVAVQRLTPRLWPPVTRLSTLRQGYTGAGLDVASGLVTPTGAHVPDTGCAWYLDQGCGARVDAVGYFHTYHPYSHYWPLQLTTTALILTVTALLTAACFLLLRRLTGKAVTR
ncbi:ABC transporter permease [Streptomyces sp. NPDC051987]|uniref:ABC transporter permease n=1 Tax=Streptomyces sp. NPDC051987 TaxID=3155808 RepID=UPI003434D9C5